MSIIDEDALAAYLRRDLAGDPLAPIVIDATLPMLQRLTEQELIATGETPDVARFRTRGVSNTILLPELPVTAVDEVNIDDEVFVDWELRRGGLLVRTDGANWPAGAEVMVDYHHGYEEAEFPGELKMIALTIAARLYHQGLARQETVGASSITFSTPASTDFSAGELLLLATYRAPRQAGEVELVPA